MDLSFRGIILFAVIIFPGLVFRRFFYQGEFTKQFSSKPWIISILYSVIPGIAIHSFLILSIHFGYGFKNIDLSPLDRFYHFFKIQKIRLDIIDSYFIFKLILYYVLIIIISWLFAILCWNFVRSFKLDSKYKVFRFQNYWNYYFKGDLKYFPEFKKLIIGKILLTRADVLVSESEGKTRMYTGDLRQYTIKKDNSLENIYLTNTSKVLFHKETKKPYKKEIPGDCFIIPYDRVINLNLNYIANKGKRKRDFSAWFIVLWILFTLYVIFTGNSFFTSEKLLITILIRIFYCFYSFLIVGLLILIFESNIKIDEKLIENYLNSDDKSEEGSLYSSYKVEIQRKRKQEERVNAIKGLSVLLMIITVIIILINQ